MLALQLHRFLQCLIVIVRRDDVHGNGELVRADYEGPVWIRLRFPGSVELSRYSYTPRQWTGNGSLNVLLRGMCS
jgi:hypothetical protein